MGPDFGKDVTQIALTLAGITLVGLILSHAKEAATIINATASGYSGLLRTASFQSGFGNPFSM